MEFKKYVLAIFLSFAVCLVLGPIVIPMLRRLKFGQQVRTDGPQTHLVKQGTPTMGGIMFVVGILASLALVNYKDSILCVFAAAVTLGYAVVGFLDDFIKIYKRRSLGLRAYQKIIGQLGIAIVLALFAKNQVGTEVYIPFASHTWDLGAFYVPFAVFVIIAMVNAVNLTDGLDGLASGVTMLCMAAFTVMAYYLSKATGATGDIALFAAGATGATLGFLVFNTYPAKVIMGDTGSLALGGALSAVALFTKLPLLLPIMGIAFVASVLSDIIQVGSYKIRKKRVFKMAPLHHHFELCGVPETKIVAMYMLVTLLASLISILGVVWGVK